MMWTRTNARRFRRGVPAKLRRLHVERLEQRLVLANLFGNNPAGGLWETAANWSINSPAGPLASASSGPVDTASITLDGVYTVTVSSSPTIQSLTLGGLTGTQTFALNAGTFRETAGSAVNANGVPVLNTAALASDGGLAVTGAL